MEEQQLLDQLAEAERRLAKATAHLHIAEAQALVSVTYDTDEFDQVVMRYREAKRECEAVHEAWRRWEQTQQTHVAPRQGTGTSEETPFIPTPRLLFARWLYQHGCIAG
jgi:hypothetical protein